MITQKRLKELLFYSPETGLFTWKVSRGGVAPGQIAGHKMLMNSGKSYIGIRIDKVRYLAHRLAFLYMDGKFPDNETDHEDGDGTNNKWLNIREATALDNARNHRKQSNNTSGVTGVLWDKERGRWKAMIWEYNKPIFLGRFDDFNDAVAARNFAVKEYGFHENHGTERPL